MLLRGTVDDRKAEGLRLASTEESFNGIVVAGTSEYLIQDVKADFEGFGDNDFLGVGCVVTAVDHSNVTIENCEFTLSGVTRCAVHAGGDANLLVRNTRITNISPASSWLGSFSWQICLCGTNRLVQLADNANVTYENCDLISNGWGICSIDGTWESVRMLLKDSRLRLSGPRSHGYGAFCIGENEVILDHCDVAVNGYPLMLMGMEGLGRAAIRNCAIRGSRFGVFVVGDDNSLLDIEHSTVETDQSSLCIKGSSTVINVTDTRMQPGNGTIVQLMDTEESGMNVTAFHVPVGVADVPLADRDLTQVSPTEDVTLNFTGCTLVGALYNSTTNIRAYQHNEIGGMGEFHDALIGIRIREDGSADAGAPIAPLLARHHGDDLRGPKNMGVNLTGTRLTGVISSALQAYREGVTRIDESNRMELSNVTQTAAPAVNNGVVVTLDATSVWEVTSESYLTALTLAPGSELKAPAGKQLRMTVNGDQHPIAPGRYTGQIVLTVC